jgi:hypothetical protein
MLFRKLQGVETGTELVFSLVSGRGTNPPQSLSEAIRVCQNEHANYLLYGFISYRDYTIYSEIKFLSYEQRAVTHVFYAVDDLDNLDRLIEDLTIKILSFIEDSFNLQILEKESRYTEWWLPGSLGYWTPIGHDWTKLIIGTGLFNGGIRFVPTDRLFVWKGMAFYLSAGFEVSYQFGLGNPDRYKAYDHILSGHIPIRMHMKLNEQHSVSFGAGFLYTFDLLQMEAPYEDSALTPYRAMGISGILGYEFKLRDTISLIFDNQAEVHFYERPIFTYSPRIGVSYRFSSREVVKKWD